MVKSLLSLDKLNIAVIGLGYVGLPLAVEFSTKFKVLGFDINQARVDELISGIDSTLEVASQDLISANKITFSSSKKDYVIAMYMWLLFLLQLTNTLSLI